MFLQFWKKKKSHLLHISHPKQEFNYLKNTSLLKIMGFGAVGFVFLSQPICSQKKERKKETWICLSDAFPCFSDNKIAADLQPFGL